MQTDQFDSHAINYEQDKNWLPASEASNIFLKGQSQRKLRAKTDP